MKKLTSVFLLIIIISCTPLSPFTSAPGYMLMTHDYLTKAERLREYSEKGDVYSQYKLGLLYCCGNESWNNNQEAIKWFCISAKNGYAKSMLELGKLYENSKKFNPPVIKTDLEKAYFWYSVAADRYVNYEASLAKKELAKSIPQETIRKVELSTHSWRLATCP